MPKTEAGKRLFERERYNARSFAIIRESDIDAIEAEAIAIERARLREAVEGMAGWLTPAGVRDDPLSDPVSRASVLALLEGGTR